MEKDLILSEIITQNKHEGNNLSFLEFYRKPLVVIFW
jgi:hypothetical protein